ncbi:hypothetical protein L7F22_014828 [Adiantum nelumboides]|nr:hypothetical protein [Adiantum nelumboides]
MEDSVDQVSTVSTSEVSEVLDDLKDEILSTDLGQGLVLEIDETLTSEENNLQIVPWNIQEEVGASIDSEDEQKIFMHKGADILSTCHLLSYFDCPPILLCRLIPYAKIRGLRDDVSGLKAAFDDIKNKWDAIWKDINNEFEQELSKSVQLKDLSSHMFYVWEGNHKTVALMEAIQDKFSNSKEKHCCVLCTIIDPTKVSKIALLTKNEFMLNIIDPSLGIDWHAKVLGLKWGADGWAILEKITMIATHDTPIQSKILWISLLEAGMVNRNAYGLQKSDQAFREYGHGRRLQMANFVDQVSTMSASEVSEVPDDLKDEILSTDLGQGLVLEIDETLASEENNLQIVPWNIQEEVGASIDFVYPPSA